jgi:hypothetical protein
LAFEVSQHGDVVKPIVLGQLTHRGTRQVCAAQLGDLDWFEAMPDGGGRLAQADHRACHDRPAVRIL